MKITAVKISIIIYVASFAFPVLWAHGHPSLYAPGAFEYSLIAPWLAGMAVKEGSFRGALLFLVLSCSNPLILINWIFYKVSDRDSIKIVMSSLLVISMVVWGAMPSPEPSRGIIRIEGGRLFIGYYMWLTSGIVMWGAVICKKFQRLFEWYFRRSI